MHASFFLKALIGITVIIEAAEVQLHSRSYRLLDRRQKGRGGGGNGRGKGGGGQGQAGNNGKGNGNGNNDLELDPSVINTGSQITGLEKNADPGQAPSVPSQNNNINFCSGKTITDGLQNKDGSCNPGE
ncbi:hypothetical protein G6O67_007664 [Ophiocordyceps sinensis]|uniref:Uncharacterized protein n=1 Tax=Ophiocordyceps sinensis TaxID=72228 RepID=A0A8H4PLF2_9HYPO|nr:hypothetical protein G6O67_007664 [Ophiocordyceps sinensis]